MLYLARAKSEPFSELCANETLVSQAMAESRGECTDIIELAILLNGASREVASNIPRVVLPG
jgi:hypothetical protein